MKTQTKTLFGGALLSAGVVTQTSAQSFTLPGNTPPYADTYLFVSGYDYYDTSYLFNYNSPNGGFGDNLGLTLSSGTLSQSAIDTNVVSAETDGTGLQDAFGFAFMFASAYGYLSVTEDAALDLAWDFTGENPRRLTSPGRIEIVDWSAGGVVIFETTELTAGTDSIQLAAGTNYGITVVASAGPGGVAFATATLIPAPASAALLGLGGPAVIRRRR
ncbi:MAG: hypothetical protein AAF937_12145 [Planctomycetota bacterium]